ncbi:MAG TPA: hypothetical protein VK721_13155 [Solirubrobacteraceae bacterium]|nr:hypothetical protein [Solirubrobacteraceae bacterium]
MSPRRRRPSTPATSAGRADGRSRMLRAALTAMLGVAAAVLVACGASSTGKLIPVADSGPLQGDFETVAQEAESGNGNCSATETAIAKTEQDFNALPGSVDSGLADTLRQGIENLRKRALALCAQPLAQNTATNTTPKTSTTTSTTTPTAPTTTPSTTTPTTPIPTTPTPTTPATPGGGTPAAPGEATPGIGSEQGGTGAGEGNGEASEGAGAGGIGADGQEGGK